MRFSTIQQIVTLQKTALPNINPSRPDPGRRKKINYNFYFHFSLWCHKRFYEGVHKTFWGTAKKSENEHLS